jgi:hypothetical protein
MHRSYRLAEVLAELAAPEALAVSAGQVESEGLAELEVLVALVEPAVSVVLVEREVLVELVAGGSTTRNIAVAHHIAIGLPQTALAGRHVEIPLPIGRLALGNRSEDRAAMWRVIVVAPA